MERKIEITLERKDYISLFMMLMNKKLMLLAAIPLIMLTAKGDLGFVGSQSSVSIWSLMLPYAALVVVFVLIFLRALIAPALRQFKEAQKEFGNKFTFALSSEGFIVHGGPGNKAEYAYTRLDRALENKNYIFFFVNGGQACIFPKRQLHELDMAFLKKILPKCAAMKPGELAEAFRMGEENGDVPSDPEA